ncbi:MAG: hypothetical protein EZS28_039052, partial [Streblomastix strix]
MSLRSTGTGTLPKKKSSFSTLPHTEKLIIMPRQVDPEKDILKNEIKILKEKIEELNLRVEEEIMNRQILENELQQPIEIPQYSRTIRRMHRDSQSNLIDDQSNIKEEVDQYEDVEFVEISLRDLIQLKQKHSALSVSLESANEQITILRQQIDQSADSLLEQKQKVSTASKTNEANNAQSNSQKKLEKKQQDEELIQIQQLNKKLEDMKKNSKETEIANKQLKEQVAKLEEGNKKLSELNLILQKKAQNTETEIEQKNKIIQKKDEEISELTKTLKSNKEESNKKIFHQQEIINS